MHRAALYGGFANRAHLVIVPMAGFYACITTTSIGEGSGGSGGRDRCGGCGCGGSSGGCCVCGGRVFFLGNTGCTAGGDLEARHRGTGRGCRATGAEVVLEVKVLLNGAVSNGGESVSLRKVGGVMELKVMGLKVMGSSKAKVGGLIENGQIGYTVWNYVNIKLMIYVLLYNVYINIVNQLELYYRFT